ncbi:serine/threonine-protein kinase [Streptomyces atratus]|uniref:serine/threonine-protein kinase n=1 Tax=Streptomyces atratus TaxID=1893 RepID=UPI0021A48624|nr:serine/threonine-protein kinase [Streptomyces atratus]MCT2541616.1 serine/threonine protein kinase [Streptomyces atratus]
MGVENVSIDPGTIYRFDGKTLGRGGYADVRRAWHRQTGAEVALKRPLTTPQALDRIRVEIEAQKRLHHPNIMPIIEHDPGYAWYTMPVADGTLTKFRKELDEEDLVSILLNIADALEIAHQEDLVHRDISPNNILAIPGTSIRTRRWVVADWGMVRRPPGATENPLTRTGQAIGTDGYAAPELSDDPRTATAAADVYSLGRVTAWFLTKKSPKAGRRLLPDDEKLMHWRPFIVECTQDEVSQRTNSMAELRAKLQDVLDSRDEPVEDRAERLIEQVLLGEHSSLEPLFTLAEAYPNNSVVYIDALALLTSPILNETAKRTPERIAEIATTMARLLVKTPWGDRDLEYKGTPLAFIHTTLRALVINRQLGLAQDLATEFFRADAHCGHHEQTRRTTEWLDELDGAAERAVSRALTGGGPAVVAYYRAFSWTPRSAGLATLLAP